MRNFDVCVLCISAASLGFFFANFLNSEKKSLIEDLKKRETERSSQVVERVERVEIKSEPRIEKEKSKEDYVREIEAHEKELFVQKCGNKATGWDYFKERILKNNEVFTNFTVDSEKFDHQGWGNTKGYIYNMIEEVANGTDDSEIRIIEAGAWKGRSAMNAGEACKNFTAKYGKPCYIISIDTWLASSEHYEATLPNLKSNEYINGIFNTYLNNIKVKGLDDIVYPLRLPSNAAVHVLHCFKIDAHIIFIDADHDYKPVLRDIETFYLLVKKNGIIFGDDMIWPGVERAVKEFRNYKSDKIKYYTKHQYWFYKKLQEEPRFFGA